MGYQQNCLYLDKDSSYKLPTTISLKGELHIGCVFNIVQRVFDELCKFLYRIKHGQQHSIQYIYLGTNTHNLYVV